MQFVVFLFLILSINAEFWPAQCYLYLLRDLLRIKNVYVFYDSFLCYAAHATHKSAAYKSFLMIIKRITDLHKNITKESVLEIANVQHS